jgi:hypothetical protein
MFMRLKNNELLQYIFYRKNRSLTKGCKAYAMAGGTISVYCEKIDKYTLDDFAKNIKYYGYYFFDEPLDYRPVSGRDYTDETVTNSVKLSLEETKKIIIPVLDSVTTLDDYINYRKKFNDINPFCNAENFKNDSLALIKANNHDDFTDLFNELDEYLKDMYQKGKMGGSYEEQRALYYNGIMAIPNSRDVVYSNSEMYNNALEEADRRKKINIAMLQKIGIV